MEDVTKWNLTSVDFDPNFVNNKIDVTQNYFQTSLVSFMFQKSVMPTLAIFCQNIFCKCSVSYSVLSSVFNVAQTCP